MLECKKVNETTNLLKIVFFSLKTDSILADALNIPSKHETDVKVRGSLNHLAAESMAEVWLALDFNIKLVSSELFITLHRFRDLDICVGFTMVEQYFRLPLEG